jgi:tRNA modification GTPase
MISGSAMYGDESPITAFATTPGNSALTLIRCSGKGAVELAASVFAPDKLRRAAGNTVIHGWVVKRKNNSEEEDIEKIDEVLISVFRAPKSYTGEDSLDICCHGGHSAGKAVLDILKTAGFRDALPGEFTFRAFINGKLDLTRCESVMEVVSAKTQTGRRRAVSRLSGSLETEINEIKKLLVEVLSGTEILLDYSEDEITADADEIAAELPKRDIAIHVLTQLKKLSSSWQLERVYQEGVTLLIAGRPNAGKSSLFNSLLKEDRSIVTDFPGTTRDWIEAWVSMEGIPIRLIDTAGLRESADNVEKIGMERSLKLLQEADIVLYLLDGTEGITGEDRDFINKLEQTAQRNIVCSSAVFGSRSILVWNKCDIAPLPQPFPVTDYSPVSVSAKTGEGLDTLCAAITSAVSQQSSAGLAELLLNDIPAAAVGTIRQKNLVDAAYTALEEALALAQRHEPLDLIAPFLRDAVNALGEITGEVSTADILEEMFSKFCIGK